MLFLWYKWQIFCAIAVMLTQLYPTVCGSREGTYNKITKLSTMLNALKEILQTRVSLEDVLPNDKQTLVECSLLINKVTAVQERAQTFSLDVYLNTFWTDARLDHPNITEEFIIPDKYHSKIWLPDIGFSNAQGGNVHKVTEDNLGVTVGANGSVHMTTRVAIDLSCPMNFRFYPMDTQLCELQLQSWRYNEEELVLVWGSLPEDPEEGLPQYELYINTSEQLHKNYGYKGEYKCVETYESSGKGSYSCLELNFIFKRNLGFYAMDIYVPSALIVLISFIAPFIDYNVLPARIAIGSLSVTATTNVIKSLRLRLPPVSYTKAADVWVWTCQIFVFLIFLELGVVNYCARRFKGTPNRGGTFLQRSTPAKTVDKISRLLFPIAFALFVIVYWAYCIPASHYNDDIVDITAMMFKNGNGSKTLPG